jgi:hypothetical protein
MTNGYVAESRTTDMLEIRNVYTKVFRSPLIRYYLFVVFFVAWEKQA